MVNFPQILLEQLNTQPQWQDYFKPTCQWFLAVSGGADSMALLAVAHAWQLPIQPIVVHFNHGYRASADEDEAFVEAFCKRLGFGYVSGRPKSPLRYSETAARAARYAFFDSVLSEYQGQNPDRKVCLALAHHLQDQIETFFLALARGTSFSGLQGMPIIRHPYVRPFLDQQPSALRAYLESLGWSWREDETNTDLWTPRNRLRHQVLPAFYQLNPHIHSEQIQSHVLALMAQVRETAQALEGLMDAHWARLVTVGMALMPQDVPNEQPIYLSFFASLFSQLSTAEQSALAKKMLENFGQGGGQITRKHLDRFKAFVGSEQKCMDWGFGLKMERQGDQIYVHRTLPSIPFHLNWTDRDHTTHQLMLLSNADAATGQENDLRFDFVLDCAEQTDVAKIVQASFVEKMKQVIYNNSSLGQWTKNDLPFLVVRTRKAGDFYLNTQRRHRPLKKWFNEIAMPTFLRDRVGLVALGQQIIHVSGFDQL